MLETFKNFEDLEVCPMEEGQISVIFAGQFRFVLILIIP